MNTGILISSSGFIWGVERALRARRFRVSLCMTSIAIALGLLFVGVQLKEWHDKTYGPTSNLYGSLYFTITGFHLLHVAVGLVVLSLLLVWTALGHFDERPVCDL